MSDLDNTIQWLLEETGDLIADLERDADDGSRSAGAGAGARLRASALRPLQEEAGPAAPDHLDSDDVGHGDEAELLQASPSSGPAGVAAPGAAGQPSGRLWELAYVATELRCRQPGVAGLGEAVAVLQDLALGQADDETLRAGRLAELTALQAELTQQIQAVPDGPYLVTSPQYLFDHLGVSISTRPLMACAGAGSLGSSPPVTALVTGSDSAPSRTRAGCPTAATATSGSR